MMSDVLSLTTAVSMNTITWHRRLGIVMLKVKGNFCLGEKKQALHCTILRPYFDEKQATYKLGAYVNQESHPSGKHVHAMNTPLNPTFI